MIIDRSMMNAQCAELSSTNIHQNIERIDKTLVLKEVSTINEVNIDFNIQSVSIILLCNLNSPKHTLQHNIWQFFEQEHLTSQYRYQDMSFSNFFQGWFLANRNHIQSLAFQGSK